MLDQRDQAVNQLSSLIGVQVVTQSNGAYNVFVGNGQPLVVGSTPYGVQTVPSASDPSELTLAFKGSDASASSTPQYLNSTALSGGVVVGLLDLAQAKLGAIATSFAAQLNNQNALGIVPTATPAARSSRFKVADSTTVSNTLNKGSGTVTAQFDDTTKAPTSDWTVSFNGTNYAVTDSAGNAIGTIKPSDGKGTFIGITINVSGTPQQGDKFTIQSTRGALDSFALATTSNSAVAAAVANTGSGVISSASVTKGYSLPQDISLSFDGTSFKSTVPVTVGTASYNAGDAIPYDANAGLTITSNEYRALLRRHWISLTVGVTVGILVAVGGSLMLAKLLHLSPELQRSLATRSVSTPFALAVSDKIHASRAEGSHRAVCHRDGSMRHAVRRTRACARAAAHAARAGRVVRRGGARGRNGQDARTRQRGRRRRQPHDDDRRRRHGAARASALGAAL